MLPFHHGDDMGMSDNSTVEKKSERYFESSKLGIECWLQISQWVCLIADKTIHQMCLIFVLSSCLKLLRCDLSYTVSSPVTLNYKANLTLPDFLVGHRHSLTKSIKLQAKSPPRFQIKIKIAIPIRTFIKWKLDLFLLFMLTLRDVRQTKNELWKRSFSYRGHFLEGFFSRSLSFI